MQQSLREAVALRQPGDDLRNATIDEAEVAGIGAERRAAHLVVHGIEGCRGRLLHARIVLAARFRTNHHIVTGPPAVDHLAKQFGRVLKVHVDETDDLPFGMVEAGGERPLLSIAFEDVRRRPGSASSAMG